MGSTVPEKSNDKTLVLSVYILYLVSILITPCLIVGVIMAFVNIGTVPDWLKSHYQFQVRTFWMLLLYCTIAFILLQVIIGVLLFFVIFIWFVARCAKGIQTLNQGHAHPNPKTWWF